MSIDAIGIFSTAVSGMQRETNRVQQDANQIVGGDLDPKPIVDLKVAEIGFKADVKVAQTADEMYKTLLDIKA